MLLPFAQRIPSLDVLRSIAIITVFVFHYQQYGAPQWVATVGTFGWCGVDLFFVLSGYLVAGQLMRRTAQDGTVDYKDFYLRRFFRIIPSYAAVLLLYYTFPWFRERGILAPLWRYVTFTQNFGLDLSKTSTFSHAWSLCIEEQFYLLLPLFVALIGMTRRKMTTQVLLAGLLIAGFVCRYYSWHTYVAPRPGEETNGIAYFKYIYYPTYNRLDGLLAGVAIAATQLYCPKTWRKMMMHATWFTITGLLLIVVAYFFCDDMFSMHASVFGFPLVAIAWALVVLGALHPASVIAKIGRFKLFHVLAALSYCVYLTHKQLNHLVRVWLANYNIADDSITMLLVCAAVALAGGALLHFAIEKPFLQLRKRL